MTWLEEYKVFREEHPDCPKKTEIGCLDLLMKRKYAEMIVKGEKRVEFRSMCKFYTDRLYDKDVLEYYNKHRGDALVEKFANALRRVETIHFHDYGNTWYLDVEVKSNGYVRVNREDVEFLRSNYECHELDEELREMDENNIRTRPQYYYFVVGKILKTNIELWQIQARAEAVEDNPHSRQTMEQARD